MDRRNRDEYGCIVDGRRNYPPNGSLYMSMVVHIGIVEGHLSAAAQLGGRIGLTLHEHVDQPTSDV
jgi:hypothetical protein